MPTFILETSCEGHVYMDPNCNQLQHRKILPWDFCGAVLEENTPLAGTGRGNLESSCCRAQQKGMKRDCFIPNCIPFIYSLTSYDSFLCSDWKGYWRVDVPAGQSVVVTVNTGWGSGDPERRALLREPLNQYSSSL